MNRFLGKTILYVLLLFGLLCFALKISSTLVKNRGFKNHETESSLLIMKSNEKFNILFMGISHARNFSRHKNHIRIEKILEKRIINIGQGGGECGVNEQLLYLDYFYSQGNTASTVVYVISPPLFFSEELPIASNTFFSEPFELSFFLKYLFFNTENKKERLYTYLKSKFALPWFSYMPSSKESKNEKLDSLNHANVEAGQKLIYKGTLNLIRFNKSQIRIKEAIQLSLKNNSKVILIIPPALFGKWKGHANVEAFAKQMQKLDGVEYYDFSESVLSPKYYYDHHHLNTNGVVHFTENFLKPIWYTNTD